MPLPSWRIEEIAGLCARSRDVPEEYHKLTYHYLERPKGEAQQAVRGPDGFRFLIRGLGPPEYCATYEGAAEVWALPAIDADMEAAFFGSGSGLIAFRPLAIEAAALLHKLRPRVPPIPELETALASLPDSIPTDHRRLTFILPKHDDRCWIHFLLMLGWAGILTMERRGIESILTGVFHRSIVALEWMKEDCARGGIEAPNGANMAAFQCSKAELLRALGKDNTSTRYLEQLVRAGRLVMKDADERIGHSRYLVRFTDPEEHTRVIDAIRRERSEP